MGGGFDLLSAPLASIVAVEIRKWAAISIQPALIFVLHFYGAPNLPQFRISVHGRKAVDHSCTEA